MDPNCPWSQLSSDEREKLLNSIVKIQGNDVQLNEIDELEKTFSENAFFESLSEVQIDHLRDGIVIEVDENIHKIEGNVAEDERKRDENALAIKQLTLDEPDGSKQVENRPCYAHLTEKQKEIVRNAIVQMPGYKTTLEKAFDGEIKCFNALESNDIQKLLNGEILILFKHLTESLDTFERTKGAAGGNEEQYGGGGGGLRNQLDNNDQTFRGDRDNSRDDNNTSGSSSNNQNRTDNNQTNRNQTTGKVFFRELEKFRELWENTYTVLLLKSRFNDNSLFYIYKHFKEKFINEQNLIFYCDFSKPKYSEVFEKITKHGQMKFPRKLCEIAIDLTLLETLIIENKYPDGNVIFMMDNIECIRNTQEFTTEQLKQQLLIILKEIQLNSEGYQSAKNKQLIVTNTNHAAERQKYLDCPVRCFDREEIQNIDELDDLVDLDAEEETKHKNAKIILFLRKFGCE